MNVLYIIAFTICSSYKKKLKKRRFGSGGKDFFYDFLLFCDLNFACSPLNRRGILAIQRSRG